jgi:hypothetical protein
MQARPSLESSKRGRNPTPLVQSKAAVAAPTVRPNPAFNRTRRIRVFCLANVAGGGPVNLFRWASRQYAARSQPTATTQGVG